MSNDPPPRPNTKKSHYQWMAAGSAFAKAVIRDSEREEPMNQVDGCCQHGELLDKYCPECAKEDREAEDKEFKPKEGDRILVGWIGDQIDYERTYIYTDKWGKFVCVDSAYEVQYREGNDYVAQSFPYAKPMNQVGRRCKHGELLDNYCSEYAKEDKEAEKKEFNPQEGDRILVGVDRSLLLPRIFLYMDRHGRCACVHSDDEEIYNNGSLRFRIVIWPCAKPMPPKLPEFIQGDPVIVWGASGKEHIRIVDSTTEDGHLMCYNKGRFSGSTTGYSHYKPFLGYNYGRRNVFEV
jgi:hypothetical protein